MANTTTSLKKSDYRGFIQPDGWGTQVHLLDCITIGDITVDQGAIEPSYCQSLVKRGVFIVDYTVKNAPALPTTSITAKMQSVPIFLDSLCPDTNFYLLAAPCNSPNTFKLTSGGNLIIFPSAAVTSKTIPEAINMGENGDILNTFDIVGTQLVPPTLFPVALESITTAETTQANDIATINDACANACSEKIKDGEIYYIACDAVALATANILVKYKGNTQPTATSADPFIADEDVSTILLLPIDTDTIRVITFRGTTDAGNPAEAAYADVDIVADPTTTVWTTIDIGSTNAEFTVGGNSAYGLPNGIIYAVTDAGKIHKSIDFAVSWSDITSPTANQLNVVKSTLKNSNLVLIAGASNTIALSNNGGTTWSTIIGPTAQAAQAIISAHLFDKSCYWIGYDDGALYYTKNGGKTWTQSVLPTPAGFASVDRANDIEFFDFLNGYISGMATDGSADEFGVIWKTFDGGFSWKVYTAGATFSSATPTGFNALVVNNVNSVLSTGDPIAALTSIYSLAAAEPIF